MLTPELKELMVSGNFDKQFVEHGRLKFDRCAVEFFTMRVSLEGKLEMKIRHTFFKGDIPVSFHDSPFMRIGDTMHMSELVGSIRFSIDDRSGD